MPPSRAWRGNNQHASPERRGVCRSAAGRRAEGIDGFAQGGDRMIESALPLSRVILYEGPRSEPLELPLRARLLQSLLERGYAVRRVRGHEVSLHSSGQAEEPLILGRFGGQLPEFPEDYPDLAVRLRDITGLTLEEIVALVDNLCAPVVMQTNGKRWKPWFPVIDYKSLTKW